MCFHKSTPQDILWGNKKGVGSAQRRRNGRVLHHGSIKLQTSILEGNIATIAESAKDLTPQSFAPRLIEAFQATLGLQFERGVPNPVELEHAATLGKRYSSEEFLNRR
jgi:lipoate-protein ligase A